MRAADCNVIVKPHNFDFSFTANRTRRSAWLYSVPMHINEHNICLQVNELSGLTAECNRRRAFP